MVNRVMVMMLVLVLLPMTSSCGIKGIKEWASNKVIIEVQDASGHLISRALVESSENQQIESNERGKATLYYQMSGLKVITISAENYITKQIKVNMPKDTDKIVNVVLPSKNSRE